MTSFFRGNLLKPYHIQMLTVFIPQISGKTWLFWLFIQQGFWSDFTWLWIWTFHYLKCELPRTKQLKFWRKSSVVSRRLFWLCKLFIWWIHLHILVRLSLALIHLSHLITVGGLEWSVWRALGVLIPSKAWWVIDGQRRSFLCNAGEYEVILVPILVGNKEYWKGKLCTCLFGH